MTKASGPDSNQTLILCTMWNDNGTTYACSCNTLGLLSTHLTVTLPAQTKRFERAVRNPKPQCMNACMSIRTTMHACMQGVFSWLCITRLSNAVAVVFGVPTAAFFAILSCTQFHIPFYASRTLPNVFAFGPVVLALAHYIDGSELWLTPVLLTATAVIMRCDMVLLAGTVCLSLVVTRRMAFWKVLLWGALSGAAALVATVAFDSVLWGRTLWPEGEVLWFNTVLNKCAAALV
jgi:hypothetical protein